MASIWVEPVLAEIRTMLMKHSQSELTGVCETAVECETTGFAPVSTTPSNTLSNTAGLVVRGDINDLTDGQLLLAFRTSGDEQLFARLVKRYERELYNYLRRFLGDEALAEDAFQQTFLQVYVKSAQFDGKRQFRPWLYTVATNQAIDLQRRNRRHRLASLDQRSRTAVEELGTLADLLSAEGAGSHELLEQQELFEWIRTAVSRLPESLQTAVQLVYFRGMKYRDAAEELAVPVGTVKSRLHSAVVKLREAWAQSCFAAA